MNRRQIYYVEAQIAKLGQPALGILEGAGFPGLDSLRSDEHLVPRSVPSLLAIDHELQNWFESRQTRALADAFCDSRNPGIADCRKRCRSVVGLPQSRKYSLEQFAIRCPRTRDHFLDECDSLQNIGRDRSRSLNFLGEIRKPRGEQ